MSVTCLVHCGLCGGGDGISHGQEAWIWKRLTHSSDGVCGIARLLSLLVWQGYLVSCLSGLFHESRPFFYRCEPATFAQHWRTQAAPVSLSLSRATLSTTPIDAVVNPGTAYVEVETGTGLESRHLESRPYASARLDLEVSAGWVSPPSRGLWGGEALLLSTHNLLEAEALAQPTRTPTPPSVPFPLLRSVKVVTES